MLVPEYRQDQNNENTFRPDKKQNKKDETMPKNDEVQTSTPIPPSTINNSLESSESNYFKSLPDAVLQELLIAYLQKHNSSNSIITVEYVGKVINHFKGKTEELDEILKSKYKESLQEFGKEWLVKILHTSFKKN